MVRQSTWRRFLRVAGVTGIAGLAGCGQNGGGGDGGGNGTEEETPADETPTDGGGNGDGATRLTWHAGGTYFPLSNEFKTVVEDNTDFTLNVQSTGPRSPTTDCTAC